VALPLVTKAAGFLADHLNVIAPVVLGIVAGFLAWKLIMLAHAVATGIVTVATTAWTVATGIAKVAQIAWAVITGVATGQVSALAAAQWLLNLALDANPIGVIVLAVVAFVAILVLLYNNVKPVRDAINWLWNEIQILWHWIVGGSPGLVPAFQALISIVQTVISIALLPIKLEFMALTWAIGVVWNILKGVGGWLASTFGGILSGTIGTIGHIVSTILGEFGKLPGAAGGDRRTDHRGLDQRPAGRSGQAGRRGGQRGGQRGQRLQRPAGHPLALTCLR